MNDNPILAGLVDWSVIGSLAALFVTKLNNNKKQTTFLYFLCGPLVFIVWILFSIYVYLEDEPQD